MNVYAYVNGNTVNATDPLGLSWWDPRDRDFAAWAAGRQAWHGAAGAGQVAWQTAYGGTDLVLDSAVTAVGGTKDAALALATTPLVAVERTLFLRPKTAKQYLAKHTSTPIEYGFSERWAAARRYDPLATVGMLAQEVPFAGNFVPSPRGNMTGPVTRVYTGGINADDWKLAVDREKKTRDDAVSHRATGTSRVAPYDRGTVVEVILGMFCGYKARGLEWTHEVLSGVETTPGVVEPGVAPGSTVRTDAHSGGVIMSSVGSNYLAAYGIGVAGQFSEQGPAVGFYNNIGELSANYSLLAPGTGTVETALLSPLAPAASAYNEPTSFIGTLLSPLYWATDPLDQHHFSWQGDTHQQAGTTDRKTGRLGNEWNSDKYQFMQ